MESSKSNISKIILSSVAFGAASFGIGMLVSKNNVGTAFATGAMGGTASLTGSLVTGRKKEEDSNPSESHSNQIQELQAQEKQLQESIAEKATKKDEVEVGINSLHTEQQQLVEEIANLNTQKQKLETEYTDWNIKVQESEQKQQQLNQDLFGLETKKQELKQEQENLNQNLTSLQEEKQELETTLGTKQTELEQKISEISQSQQQQEEIERTHHTLKSQVEELEKQKERLNQSLATDNTYIESINQQSNQELEGLVGNLSDSELEELSVETPLEMELESEDAELETFSEDMPFSLDAEEHISETESPEALEDLMGNISDSELEQLSMEAPLEMELESEAAAVETFSEDMSFSLDSEEHISSEDNTELEDLMGNISDSDVEDMSVEAPLEMELESEAAELETFSEDMPFSLDAEEHISSEDTTELEDLMGNISDSELEELSMEAPLEMELESEAAAVETFSEEMSFSLDSEEHISSEDTTELEDLMGNISDSDVEDMSAEAPLEMELESEAAELETFSEDMPFSLDAEEHISETESPEALEDLMGNISDSELEELSMEAPLEMELESEAAAVETFSEEMSFSLDSEEHISSEDTTELEDLMGNISDSDVEDMSAEAPFGIELESANAAVETFSEEMPFSLDSEEHISSEDNTELEDLMGNISDSDVEDMSAEAPFGIELESANAAVETFSEEMPFSLDAEEHISSEDTTELEDLMGNISDSELEELSMETPVEMELESETAEVEAFSEDMSFSLDAEEHISSEDTTGNISDSDVEDMSAEAPFGIELESANAAVETFSEEMPFSLDAEEHISSEDTTNSKI